MLALIVREAAPLFWPASHSAVATAALPKKFAAHDVVALAVESDLQGKRYTAGILFRDGNNAFVSAAAGVTGQFALSQPEDGTLRILKVEEQGNNVFSILDEHFTLARVVMNARLGSGDNSDALQQPTFTPTITVPIDPERGTPMFAMIRGDSARYRAVVVYADGTVMEKMQMPGKGLAGTKKPVKSERLTQCKTPSPISAAALNNSGDQLYLGTLGGDVVFLDLTAAAAKPVVPAITPVFHDRRAITSVRFLNGDFALAVGDQRGEVSIWFPQRETGEYRFRRSLGWEAAPGAIAGLLASSRDRGLFALDAAGGIRWLYSTTGNVLLTMPAPASPVRAFAVNPRTDALAALTEDGFLTLYGINSSYPEAGWKAFFSKLLYEGYDKPEYVWQSTGSDASEPKLSLVPLVWGSVKAAAYALLFATPLALAAAMYLSQFASLAWRNRIKPAVEMLAAVPSVVIGFLAALWLAPLLEKHLTFFTKNFHYDQRNSLVIAIAMGFAVIPTIFSLAEDAISAVPPALSAASLALGASKWQTVIRVVLPTASPGIFTAVMLGLGRAVGETMIVLMATGNTPILSLSPFNGMRTLSANIAVEMPEAPVGGTLYRTLFLCALILFALTLCINTVAEFFRHRLRQRYGRI